MNEWQETCAITSSPIRKYDEVVMIVPLDSALHSLNLNEKSIASISVGHYDGLGWNGTATAFIFEQTYLKTIFIHRLVWVLLGRNANYDIKSPPGFDHILWCEMIEIISLCEAAKVNLVASTAFKGTPPQSKSATEKINQVRMMMCGKW